MVVFLNTGGSIKKTGRFGKRPGAVTQAFLYRGTSAYLIHRCFFLHLCIQEQKMPDKRIGKTML